MKLLVEIDEETYKDIKKGKVYSSFRDVPQESVLAIANGTPIPDNATNKDIINTMFDRDMAYNIRCYVKNYMLMGEWLDAPYQKGGK